MATPPFVNVSSLLESIMDDTKIRLPAEGAELGFRERLAEQHQSGANTLELALDALNQPNAGNVEMGAAERLTWVLLFSLMVLIAAGGNIIVVYIVSTNKDMKSVTNYFLVNLSLADTMVSTLNVIFNFISMLNSHWPFGTIYCKISNFIAILSISASVFTLTAISCDRYNAILHPLRPRMSHSHAIGWILLIWTLSSTLAMPNAIYSTVVEDRLANDNIGLTCTMVWPDGRYPLSSHDHIYNIVILVVTYLVPILTMAILYYQVGKELWGYQAIGENIDKQQRAILAKKKIVKMMIVVVIIFALCWLPYHAFFVVNFYLPNLFQDTPLRYQRYYLFMYWLAMSNSMYNPIIIYFMNSNFRHEFKKILRFLCCCRSYTPELRSNNNNNNNNTINPSIRPLNHTQINRQATQDSQTKNLIRSPTVDKMSNNRLSDAIVTVDQHQRGSPLAQDAQVQVAEARINYSVKPIDAAAGCNLSSKATDSYSETNYALNGHQKHRQSKSSANKGEPEQEEEPFIGGEKVAPDTRLDLEQQKGAGEKLIDFAGGTNSSRNHKQISINSSSDKVWI